MNKLMQVPAFGTEITTTDGVIFAGVRAHNTIILSSEIDSATTAAVIADGHDILHIRLFSALLLIFSLLLAYGRKRLKVKKETGKQNRCFRASFSLPGG